jgi:hypothetical protein
VDGTVAAAVSDGIRRTDTLLLLRRHLLGGHGSLFLPVVLAGLDLLLIRLLAHCLRRFIAHGAFTMRAASG